MEFQSLAPWRRPLLRQCVIAHDRNVQDCNSLLSDYETLRLAGQDLPDACDALQSDLEDLQTKVKDPEAAQNDAAACLFLAQSHETSEACLN